MGWIEAWDEGSQRPYYYDDANPTGSQTFNNPGGPVARHPDYKGPAVPPTSKAPPAQPVPQAQPMPTQNTAQYPQAQPMPQGQYQQQGQPVYVAQGQQMQGQQYPQQGQQYPQQGQQVYVQQNMQGQQCQPRIV